LIVRESRVVHKVLRLYLSVGLMVIGLSGPGIGQAEQDHATAQLRLVGLDGAERVVTAEEWGKLPRATVEAKDHGGAVITFEGVAARELLKIVDAPLGGELRGERLLLYVVAEAADGYKVVYALSEFDGAFTEGLILIADRKNGQALSPNEGPLRVIVPWEKRSARWVRQLTALRLRQAP
jgi:DMSO/TMAO reductase YedYZ molybdopterin-dependent catalytic subunit